MRYRPEQVVALLDSERAGETRGRLPDRRHASTEALALEPTTALVGVATAGRPLPAGLARAAEGLHRERPRHRERPARVHHRRPRAGRARRARTASSCATCASRRAGLNVPTGENLDARREGRAHGRLRLRDREDDRRARARRRDARAAGSRASSSRPGQTGIAIAGWGISVDAVVADFIAGAAEQLVLEGVARGGELLWVEGQGSLLHPRTPASRSACSTAARRTRSSSATCAGQAFVDDDERFPMPPLAELVELHERSVADRAAGEGRGDRAQHARPRRRGGARRDRGRRGGDGPPGRRPGTLRPGGARGVRP